MTEINEDTDFFKIEDSFAQYKDVHSILIQGDEGVMDCCEVSIVIPTYKRPILLKEALDSAIYQERFQNYCILIIDNDSTRGCATEKLLGSYQNSNILYFKNAENIGMFGNQNRCFELAKSKWVVLLHDDDLLLPSFLVDCLAAIHRIEKIDGLQPKRYIWKDGGEGVGLPSHFDDNGKLRRVYDISNCVSFQAGTPSGGIFNRDKIIALGGYNPKYHPTSDFCFSINFSRECNFYILNKTLSVYRILSNESMNHDTLSKFVIHDFFLKKQLMKKYHIPVFFQDKVLSYVVGLQIKSLQKDFCQNFEFENNRLHFTKCNRLEYYIIRILIYFYTGFLSLFFNK